MSDRKIDATAKHFNELREKERIDAAAKGYDAACYWVEDDGSVHRRLAGEFEDVSCFASVALLAYANILEAKQIALTAQRDALREALKNVTDLAAHTSHLGELSGSVIAARAALALVDGAR